MLEIVDLLLKAGYDVDKEDKKRRSPLQIACKANNIQLVNLLLDHKVA
jgi:ankyrin repeat protein